MLLKNQRSQSVTVLGVRPLFRTDFDLHVQMVKRHSKKTVGKVQSHRVQTKNFEEGVGGIFLGGRPYAQTTGTWFSRTQGKSILLRVNLMPVGTAYPQSLSDYRATLPDFLIQLCNQIAVFDHAGVLSFQNLDRAVDDIILDDKVEPRSLFWLHIDPDGKEHILADDLRVDSPASKPPETEAVPFTFEEYTHMVKTPNPQILGRLGPNLIKAYRATHMNCIQQLHNRAASKRYAQPTHFIKDFSKMMNWNIIYRTKSPRGIAYLSGIISYFFELLAKKNFAKKFDEKHKIDLLRLFRFQLELKVETKQWPSIPTEFREYEPITEYIPVPQSRASIINRRMESKKVPVQCPKDCACLRDRSERFCMFSLASGTWQTQCPNRKAKIECNHADQEEHGRCRNSEIRKKERKTCRIDNSSEGKFDIEECIIWGIDYYTRNNIFITLPEKAIKQISLVQNNEQKNEFIDECLLTALNFLGIEGYDIRKACEFIIANTPAKVVPQGDSLDWTYVMDEQAKGNFTFKKSNRLYAKCLLNILNTCPDPQAFRVHSKGKGARCLNKQGIKSSEFIVEYYGEIYEPWRWYERQDFTKKFMKELKMSESIPDFYNIYLEKHKDEQDGHDMLIVDPIHKGNYSSRFSHSCNPNCGTIITVSDGRYYIGMYALRDIQYGEELTFDYCSTTQSRYEHKHAICLCGTKQCIGYYLQLSISKPINTILDKHYCFLQRTVVLLKSVEKPVQQDYDVLAKHNIKGNVLDSCPAWLIKWTSLVMRFLDFECEEYYKIYLKEMIDNRTENVPVEGQEVIPTEREQVYAEIGKHELFARRFQNLTTTIDKLTYYVNSIKDASPPLTLQPPEEVYDALWSLKSSKQPSVMFELKENFEKYRYNREVMMIEDLDVLIDSCENWADKLLLVRYGFLILSHQLKINKFNSSLQNRVLSDIMYMYAFTHHYFTPHEYEAHSSEEVIISPKEFLNFSNKKQEMARKKDFHQTRKYSSQFVWGQLVAWYKQTIAQPQASLSQDRRGTLSFPTIETLIRSSSYPFEGNNRQNFFKALQQKPHSSWPPEKCPWSYKNSKKSYGTMLFESHYSSDLLKPLEVEGVRLSEQPGRKLISAAIQCIDFPLAQKKDLFINTEHLITSRSKQEITAVISKYTYEEFDFEESKRTYEHRLNSVEKRSCKKLKKD